MRPKLLAWIIGHLPDSLWSLPFQPRACFSIASPQSFQRCVIIYSRRMYWLRCPEKCEQCWWQRQQIPNVPHQWNDWTVGPNRSVSLDTFDSMRRSNDARRNINRDSALSRDDRRHLRMYAHKHGRNIVEALVTCLDGCGWQISGWLD